MYALRRGLITNKKFKDIICTCERLLLGDVFYSAFCGIVLYIQKKGESVSFPEVMSRANRHVPTPHTMLLPGAFCICMYVSYVYCMGFSFCVRQHRMLSVTIGKVFALCRI